MCLSSWTLRSGSKQVFIGRTSNSKKLSQNYLGNLYRMSFESERANSIARTNSIAPTVEWEYR